MPFLIRLIIVKVLILIAATVFAVMAMGAETEPEYRVEPTTVHDLKAVFATVESVDTIDARTRIGGTLTELLIDEGDTVTAGQLVASVVDPKLRSQREAVEARIASLESERALAATDLERARKLRKTGAVAQARLDEATSKYEVALRNLKAMQAEREVIEKQEGEGAVYAPADGRVIRVPVTRGAVVLAGEPVATIAANAFILRMQLPERHARFLKVGDEVRIGERGLGATRQKAEGNAKTGSVQQIYPEIRQGRVVADVTVPDLGDFFVGERVLVYVPTGERETFVVPPEYLFHRFGVGFVKLSDGTEVVVQPGMPVDGGIEVLSGLRAGDVLLPAPTASN